ncbi:MAG: DNA gyrase inhibitor YacG [Gammaproteobacteria bacterium]
MSRKMHCPTCGRELVWDKSNPFRPFCSERCKLIDLGEWASESHRIPGERISDPNNTKDRE